MTNEPTAPGLRPCAGDDRRVLHLAGAEDSALTREAAAAGTARVTE